MNQEELVTFSTRTDSFMVSWTKGDPTGATVAGPFKALVKICFI